MHSPRSNLSGLLTRWQMHHDEIIRAELSKVSHLPLLISFQTLTQLDSVFQQHVRRQRHAGREGGMQLATEGHCPGAVVEGLLAGFDFSGALPTLNTQHMVSGNQKDRGRVKKPRKTEKMQISNKQVLGETGLYGKDRERVWEPLGWSSDNRRKLLNPHNTSLRKLLCSVSLTLAKLQSSPGLNRAGGQLVVSSNHEKC